MMHTWLAIGGRRAFVEHEAGAALGFAFAHRASEDVLLAPEFEHPALAGVAINGVPLGAEPRGRLHPPSVRWEIGASNTLTFRSPSGAKREITIEVRPWTWHDVLFTEGATDVIALLFFVGAFIGAVFTNDAAVRLAAGASSALFDE